MKNLRMLLMVLVVLISTPAWGAFLDWTNSTGNQDFTDPCNWSATPTSADARVVNMTGDDAAILSSTDDCLGLRISNAADGTLSIVAGANLTVGGSDVKIGDTSPYIGTVNMTGGSVSAVGTACYTTIGDGGDGYLNISGGTWHSDRVTLAQQAGDIGQVALSGNATLTIDQDLKGYGSGGQFKVRMEGSNAQITIGDDIRSLTTNESSLFDFVLNGASGVGNGIVVGDALTLVASSEIDLSFMGSQVDGTYTLMTAGGLFADPGGLLSAASVAAGWSYEIVAVGETLELQATIPEPATISLLLVGGLATLIRRKK